MTAGEHQNDAGAREGEGALHQLAVRAHERPVPRDAAEHHRGSVSPPHGGTLSTPQRCRRVTDARFAVSLLHRRCSALVAVADCSGAVTPCAVRWLMRVLAAAPAIGRLGAWLASGGSLLVPSGLRARREAVQHCEVQRVRERAWGLLGGRREALWGVHVALVWTFCCVASASSGGDMAVTWRGVAWHGVFVFRSRRSTSRATKTSPSCRHS